MKREKLKDVLPELGRVMAKDFSDFGDEWEKVLRAYAGILEWLSSSRLKSENIEKAVVIERRCVEEWEREDYDSDGGEYDETGRL